MARTATVIRRRGLLMVGAATFVAHQAAAALPVPPGNSLAFRLMRRGSDIGSHLVKFETQGDNVTVHVAVEARVTLLSIPIVHYAHEVVETWERGILTGITGKTDKNGRTEWMNARRGAGGLVVQGSRTDQYVAPEQAIGTSYWNKHMLDGPMISLEDGVLLRPKITPRGAGPIPLASGGTIDASRYNLSGSFNVDVWYDQANTWASLAFTVADGSDVQYERL